MSSYVRQLEIDKKVREFPQIDYHAGVKNQVAGAVGAFQSQSACLRARSPGFQLRVRKNF
jgi:hypothetical protein